MPIKIRYNAPVILTFSLLAILILLLSTSVWPRLNLQYFATGSPMQWNSLVDWFRLFSHALGHAHWSNLTANLTLILLLGPLLESRYGSRSMLVLILLTALATGLINVALFKTGLMGASGVVFMLIILASMSDFRAGSIPLTFVLVAIIFLGREVMAILDSDTISQLAHLIGGVVGAAAGLLMRR